MSRHFAAYFAIVGTLAFAPGGAANAGQFNIPHSNSTCPRLMAIAIVMIKSRLAQQANL